jgi:hypothetical protein
MYSMKLTEWFPPDVKPVRVGVYLRDYEDDFPDVPAYCYWDGVLWHPCETTPMGAFQLMDDRTVVQALKWRGLAENP